MRITAITIAKRLAQAPALVAVMDAPAPAKEAAARTVLIAAITIARLGANLIVQIAVRIVALERVALLTAKAAARTLAEATVIRTAVHSALAAATPAAMDVRVLVLVDAVAAVVEAAVAFSFNSLRKGEISWR